MQSCLFIRRGQCSQSIFTFTSLIRLLKSSHQHSHILEMLYIFFVFLCLTHVYCLSALLYWILNKMSLLYSGPLAVMEASSVYMCFPCYREFNTLEEVLQHQLTCTAEDEQPDPSGTAPIAVPVLQTQVSPEQVSFSHVLTWVL